jgi:hypothetical protein
MNVECWRREAMKEADHFRSQFLIFNQKHYFKRISRTEGVTLGRD